MDPCSVDCETALQSLNKTGYQLGDMGYPTYHVTEAIKFLETWRSNSHAKPVSTFHSKGPRSPVNERKNNSH
jgi:hypothetical protein